MSIDRIRPNPHQPRHEFDPADLQELADSIRSVGILQPVVARPAGDGYELLVGERRLRAARLAGLQTIPVLVREADELQALEQALIENVQRANLRPLEEAEAYKNLTEVFDLTQEQVARRVGKSRPQVTNTLRLLDLPSEARQLLADGSITAGHARAILAIKEPAAQAEMARRAAAEGLSVRQVEALAKPEAPPVVPSRPKGTRGSRSHPDLEEALSDRFSTDVRVQAGRGRGRIVISFGSREDLERIASLLLQ